jgi:UDP-GlcNAc:undecaprenyl-phosphate GlcNAc-1-phosphate transferase
LRRGKNPLTTPGKDHISHRLAYLLGSRREAVLVCYLICCAFGVAAIFVSQASFREAFVVALSIAGLSLYALWRLEFRNGGVRPQ